MKMKPIILSMLAMAALAGCSKNDRTDDREGGGEVLTGEATYATFSFKVNGTTTTYSGMPEEQLDAQEKTVNDIYMLIFDATNGKAGKLITKAEGANSGSLTVKTTSGSKRIYVLTNVKDKTQIYARLNALTENTSTLGDFYTLATDGAFTSGPDTDMGDGFKELIVQGKMVMSNVADAGAVYTLHPGISETDSKNATGGSKEEKNNLDFTVYRAVAKANLKIALKDGDMKTNDKIFTFKDAAAFSIRNINRSVFLIQQYASDMLASTNQDHTKDDAIRPWSPFYDKFDNRTDAELKDINTYIPYFFSGYDFSVATTIEGAASKSVYFSPNSMNKSLRGNTTYYGIRTQVQKVDKDEIATAISFESSTNLIKSTPAMTDYDNTAGDQSFYFVRELPSDMLRYFATGDKIRKVFTNADVAFQAMSIMIKFSNEVNLGSAHFVKGGSWTAADLKEAYAGGGANALTVADKAIVDRYVGHYDKGYCYYRLNFYETTTGNNKRHLVRRNHRYNATVTSFNTLGVPNPGDLDKDPEIPVDADVTHVTALITVAEWHDVNMSEDL